MNSASSIGRPAARSRALPSAVGLAVFTALGAVMAPRFWAETWFYLGLGIALSVVFIEPFFTRPQDGLINSLGGVGAYWAETRNPLETMWLVFLLIAIGVFLASLYAALAGESVGGFKLVAYRVSTRLGRALVIGSALLFLDVLSRAARGESHFQFLAFGVVILLVILGLDWTAFFALLSRKEPRPGVALGAIGPRMLVVLASGELFERGARVRLVASNADVVGSVVALLPHRDGVRYQLALDSDWTSLCREFPADVSVHGVEGEASVIGAADVGSTDLTIQFEPLQTVTVGSPVSIESAEGSILYQVTDLTLINTGWGGSASVIAQASARQIGRPEAGYLRSAARLPSPHQSIMTAANAAANLPTGYYQIGSVKETGIEIGIQLDEERRAHLAILGMSGMGKTAVAQRICRALALNRVVVALDTTGEYVGKLGFPKWNGDLTTNGYSVHEPVGDPPQKAAEFVAKCMTQGSNEYQVAGGSPLLRLILLEEAHSFVPEWNFALKYQQDEVSKTTRMIMQARKYGLCFVIVSQRTAVVSKSALSQCENYIIFKTIDETSLEYLQVVVGGELRKAIPALRRFEALCVGPSFNCEDPVIVAVDPPSAYAGQVSGQP